MNLLLYLLVFVLFFVGVYQVYILNESPEERKIKDEIETSIHKYLDFFASKGASEDERTSLIIKGLLGTIDFFGFNISSKPLFADSIFDCGIRKLAFEFSQKLVSSKDALKLIFDGLELGVICNVGFSSSIHYGGDVNSQEENLQYLDTKLEFFVESNINIESLNQDHYDGKEKKGSIKNPFTSIQEALNECTKMNKRKNICIVYLRKGTFFIEEPLLIQSDNIILKNYKQEEAIITSDKVVDTEWKMFNFKVIEYEGVNPLYEGIKPYESKKGISFIGKFNDSKHCKEYCLSTTNCTSFAYFDQTCGNFSNLCYGRNDGMWNPMKHSGVISGKKVLIYKTDLSKYNLEKVDQVFVNGRRAVRARFPNGNPETMGLHTIPTGYVKKALKWLPPKKIDEALDVQISSPHREATLFPVFSIGIGGPVSQFYPPQSYWGTKNPIGGGAATYKVPTGLQYSEDLEINTRSWKNPQTGYLHAYHHGHWGNWVFKLEGINKGNRTLSWSYGGFQEARGSSAGKEWYVENIFEELDVPNEWFYDEKTKILYYSPNGSAETLPSQLSIPQLPSLVRIMGDQDNPVTNVTISGVTLLHSTQTFMEKYMVPSGGDWSVHPNAALYIEGTVKTTIEGCIFDSVGGNGIYVSNFNRETVISNNLMYRSGDNGIVVVGDVKLIDGTNGNQPRGVKVLNNVIFDIGIWGKQTYPYVQSLACESVIEGNVFFNGPRAGVNINDGFGGGNRINSNLLFNFVRETDDHGPINTWDRVPYVTTVLDGKTSSLAVKENQIHRNFIINNYRSVWPIDHDDGSCFWNDTYNYLVYGGFKNYLGHDKHSLHNVYVYPDSHAGKGASFTAKFCLDTNGQTPGTSGYGDIYAHNKCIMKSSKLLQLGSCSMKNIKELIPFLANNHYYTSDANMTTSCGSTKLSLKQLQSLGLEVGTVVQHLVSDEKVFDWGKEVLELHSSFD